MKIIKITLLCLAAVALTACHDTEKAEKVQDEEIAEQSINSANELEQASIRARNAAKEFVGKHWPDTMSIQSALLEARAKQSQFKSKGASETFDSVFVNTLTTVRPDVAKELKK